MFLSFAFQHDVNRVMDNENESGIRHRIESSSPYVDVNRVIDKENEFIAQKKDGTIISIDIGLNFFGKGDSKQAIVILWDITEKKKSITALHRSQDVLNKAQSIAHLGSWEWDMTWSRFLIQPRNLHYTH